MIVYLSGALHEATDDERFLNAARAGGDYLATLITEPGDIETGSRRASLYSGVAGIGVALTLLARYDDAFTRHPLTEGRLPCWIPGAQTTTTAFTGATTSTTCCTATPGPPCFLPGADKPWATTKRYRYREKPDMHCCLVRSQQMLGRYWWFRRSQPFNLPGFSHGTAGIAFVLGSIGDIADEPAFLAAAQDGMRYLNSIAIESDNEIRIPYGWPLENWDGLYEFGWAHGLVGHAMFLQRMQQLGIGGSAASSREDQILRTLANINLPGEPADPFSEPATPLDWRFGRAAVLSLLSDSDTGQETRDAIYADIADQAVRSNGLAHWEVDAPAFMGGGRAAYTGLLHGSAGIGLALLRLHAALSDRPPYITLPDDPAAWGSVGEPN